MVMCRSVRHYCLITGLAVLKSPFKPNTLKNDILIFPYQLVNEYDRLSKVCDVFLFLNFAAFILRFLFVGQCALDWQFILPFHFVFS